MDPVIAPSTEPTDVMPAPGGLSTVGIFGAGKSGTALARRALAAGLYVTMATAAPARELATILDIVTPGASAADPARLAEGADVVILAVPLRRFTELPVDTLAGHIVVDAMNYWPPIDGILPQYEAATRPTTELVRDQLPASAKVVKAFNHLGYHQMEDLARLPGAEDRAAAATAGDEAGAVSTVSPLVDAVGFDPVVIGTLRDSAVMQPETPIFGQHLSADQLLRLARRTDVP